jgi:hypothetical protein
MPSAKIKSRGLPISASRDPKAFLQRSKLVVAEIEGLDSIHKLMSRKIVMLLTNQIKEIFIVI